MPSPRPRALPLHRAALGTRGTWREQARAAITSLEGLEQALVLTETEREGTRRALQQGLPLSLTPYYLSLCDPHDPKCPIRLQCVPRSEESAEVPGDRSDPLGEEAHSPAPNLVCRYPDRALLLVTDRCSVYCRFCTRARMVGQDGGARSEERLGPALEWLRANPHVREVILSGGDPLVMSTARLERALQLVTAIPSIELIRVGTRAPVVLPMRVTPSLCRMLRRYAPLWLMTHFNHPRELTKQAREACERLVDHGIPVMNQTVLLRGVNDDASTLEQLFRGLVRSRVRPYYLLQTDPMRGTAHLRTPLAVGEGLIAALQGKLSGIAVPRFIVDVPGGQGKVPAGPNYVLARNGVNTHFRTWDGGEGIYVDPPMEAAAAASRPDASSLRQVNPTAMGEETQ